MHSRRETNSYTICLKSKKAVVIKANVAYLISIVANQLYAIYYITLLRIYIKLKLFFELLKYFQSFYLARILSTC